MLKSVEMSMSRIAPPLIYITVHVQYLIVVLLLVVIATTTIIAVLLLLIHITAAPTDEGPRGRLVPRHDDSKLFPQLMLSQAQLLSCSALLRHCGCFTLVFGVLALEIENVSRTFNTYHALVPRRYLLLLRGPTCRPGPDLDHDDASSI